MQGENISDLQVISPEIDGYLSRAGWSNHHVEVRHQFLPLEKGEQEGFSDLAVKSPLPLFAKEGNKKDSRPGSHTGGFAGENESQRRPYRPE